MKTSDVGGSKEHHGSKLKGFKVRNRWLFCWVFLVLHVLKFFFKL